MIQYRKQGITIFESALFRTTSTVIETADCVLIVDPTWLPSEIRAIQQFVQSISKDKARYLLFTHSDYDHIIAWKAFPEAQTIASAAFVQNPDKEAVLQQIRDFDDENYIRRDYPIQYPDIDHEIETDGQTLSLGSSHLCFYQAPGHNPDGLFTTLEPAGIWLAGDYLSNIEFPYIYHSSLAYEQTLAKVEPILAQHQIKLLVPGHGDATEEQQEIRKRKTDNLNYIQELRRAINKGEKFDLTSLWRNYHFPGVMKRFHDKNAVLMEKEKMLWGKEK